MNAFVASHSGFSNVCELHGPFRITRVHVYVSNHTKRQNNCFVRWKCLLLFATSLCLHMFQNTQRGKAFALLGGCVLLVCASRPSNSHMCVSCVASEEGVIHGSHMF